MSAVKRWLARLNRGFGYLTLDPSPRLRRLRQGAESASQSPVSGPLPPLPDSAYPPGAVPLDCSGIPDSDPSANDSAAVAAPREDEEP